MSKILYNGKVKNNERFNKKSEMKQPEIVYADKKSEDILSKHVWIPSKFEKNQDELIFPFSTPNERAFSVKLSTDNTLIKGNYYIVVKRHAKFDKAKYEFNKLVEAYKMGISVKPLALKKNDGKGGYVYTLVERNSIPLLDVNFYKIKPKERESLFKLVGSTLRSWHEKGFYHGDLAPRNLLIKMKSNPKIVAVDLEKSLIQNLQPVNIRKEINSFEYQARREGANDADIQNFREGYFRKKNTPNARS